MLMSMSGTVVDAATNQQPNTFVAEREKMAGVVGDACDLVSQNIKFGEEFALRLL